MNNLHCTKSNRNRHLNRFAFSISLALVLSSSPMRGLAGESVALHQTGAATLSDLTLSNFWSDGWGESWTKRHREGTPDMSLLRVQTNFLVQLFRLDTFVETGIESAKISEIRYANAILEYAFNRRFMMALFSNYEDHKSRIGHDEDGYGGGMFGRFQLYDLEHDSLALTLKAVLPDRDLGERQTTLSYTLSGWHDLNDIGLKKMGLYYHLQHEIIVGPHAEGAKMNDLTYALSLAKIWTDSAPVIGNFTTFVECFAKTDIDGSHRGKTVASLTPGMRVNLWKTQIIMVGVDIPLTGPKPYDGIFRLTYIANF